MSENHLIAVEEIKLFKWEFKL